MAKHVDEHVDKHVAYQFGGFGSVALLCITLLCITLLSPVKIFPVCVCASSTGRSR